MKEWKKICIGTFILSNLAYSQDYVNSTDITINNDTNPAKVERQALIGGEGDTLTNTAKITVDGTDPANNANITGMRALDATITNNGEIVVQSLQGGTGIISSYTGEPTDPSESNTATIRNNGVINISGNEIIGMMGHGGNTGAGVRIVNEATGVININDDYFSPILTSGMTLKGGVVENKGVINVTGAAKNVGIEILHNDKIDGLALNSGTINLTGNTLVGIDGEEETGMIRTSNRTTSRNTETGRIIGNGNSLRGILSSKGGQVENLGEITLTGNINYGLASENKEVVGDKIAGSVINSGNIFINGDQGIGMLAINIEGLDNRGNVIITGNQGTGIKYYNLNPGELKNSGNVIIDGIENWAFATDEEKSSMVESVGKMIIRDGSRESGAFKVTGIMTRGINRGDVTATNGVRNKIIYVEDHTNSAGITTPNRANVENEGTISIQGGQRNFAIHSKNGNEVTNSGTISMNDSRGVGIYNPNGQRITNTGEIILSGEDQIGIYYENENIAVLNTGGIKIKGKGIVAFDVNDGDLSGEKADLFTGTTGNTEVKVFGEVLIDEDATFSLGAYAKNSVKTAINTGNIRIKGESSSGLIGLDGTTLKNDGTINVETKESYGIQAVNDAIVINNGSISNTDEDGIAIYMGLEDSHLYMDEKATVTGIVVSKDGVGTFHGKDEFSSSTTHEINYELKNFSHMDIASGEFIVKKDTVLTSPIRNTLSSGHEDTSSYTGNLEIALDSDLTMEIEVNRNNIEGQRYTSTIHSNSLDIKGSLTYKPLDSVYVVSDDVDEIVIPNIYTNEEIDATDDNINVLNYVSGWEGLYRLSDDKTDLSLVLKRKTGGDNLPPSYKDGVQNYPYNFLDKKYLAQAGVLSDEFKIIEKVHNAEIPYYIDASPIVASGNYKGGDKKGYFYYDTYGAKLDSYYKIKENLILGLGFTGLESKVKYRYASNEKLNTYILSANAIYQIEDFKIGGYLGGSINKHKTERDITGKDYIVDSNYESYGVILGVSGEYKYRVTRDSLIRSYINLGYIFNYIESYKETGNEYYIMNLPSVRENIPNIKIGSKWEHRSSNRFTELGINLDYFFNDMVKDRRGYYIFNEKAKYDIDSVKIPPFILSVDLKQELDLSDRLSVYGLLSAEMGEKFWQVLGRIGVTYEF